MLTEDEQTYIINVLTKHVAPMGDPRQYLTAPFINTRFPETLLLGVPPRVLVGDAVRLCLADGWASQPTWMRRLLDLCPPDARIVGMLTRIANPPPPPPDPLELTVMDTRVPFINRKGLRKQLRYLETPQAEAKPILLINGAKPKSGKSYSEMYITHFSRVKKLVTLKIKFDPEQGKIYGPSELATDLASPIGGPSFEKPGLLEEDTNKIRFTSELAQWVLNKASAQPGKRYWFVLDSFSGSELRDDTKLFLKNLSQLVTTGIYPQICRLILIDFDGSNLSVDTGYTSEEKIKPCTKEDVRACVQEILSEAIRSVDAPSISNQILAAAPVGEKWLFEINRQLRALLMLVSNLNELLAGYPKLDYLQILQQFLKSLPEGKKWREELEEELEKFSEDLQNGEGG